MYTYKDIYLKWPYGTIQLQDIHLEHEIGEHARLQVTGILDPQHEHEIITRAGSDDQIELGIRDEEGSKPLFMGQLSHIELQNVQHNLQVKIEVTSQSYKLDTRFKERSFQQVNRTYIDIVHSVISDYAKSDVLDEAFGERKTGQFIMQYQETDWAFLKRIASHAGAVLVPYVLSHGINFWIGLPESRRQIDLHEVHFRHRKVVDPYLRDTAQGKGSSIENYNRYSFEWDDILDIGDTVVRSKQNYRIIKRSAAMDKGLLKWEYECMPAQGVTVPKQWNRIITGAAIEGKVLEVRKNQVRLHLDIDEYQSPKDAQWFPYSAEGNQVWYLMPEQGAQLKLYFPSMNEDDAVAIQSVRTEALAPDAPSPAAMAVASSAPASSGSAPESVAARKERKMSDPRTKSFANPQGKEVSLSGSDLSLIGQEGAMYMSLSGSGVGLHSPLRIQVTAGGALNLNASEITIQGDEGLQVSTPQHTIELNEFASTLSPKIELQASTRRTHPKIIPPGSPEAVYLQFGGIAMKQDIGIKNAQAQSETAMGVYKETWNGLCGLATDVGDLVGTGADIAFGEATWEGSRKDLYQRNHLLQYAVERGREQQEYIESVRSGERSYGQVAFDGLQKSMEMQWAPVIGTVESLKTIAKGSGTINPYASTLEQNQEFGRRSGEASQELLLVASNFIGIGRAAKPAASAAKKLSKAEKALQGSHHEDSGGGKGIGTLLGSKDAAKASSIGQGGVKTGATAVLLMARSAFSRAGSKGSSLLAGLMSKALVKAEPFKIQRRELVPDTGHGHKRDQGYRYHDKEEHSSSHEREKQKKKNLEEGMYSGRRPEKEPDRKHGQDESKESTPMPPNKPDKSREPDKDKDSTEGTGDLYPTRVIDPVKEADIIARVKNLRSLLTSGYKKSGNFALAEVNIVGMKETEFFAHSSIDDLDDLSATLKERVPNILIKPPDPMFKATAAPNKDGIWYPRESDTEYKILNKIASELGEKTNTVGNIKLFTELDTCLSCNRVIAEFTAKYKNITVEVIHNNGNRIK